MPTCPGRDTRRMRLLALRAKLNREGLAEEAAFLVALKMMIQKELTCSLTLAERIDLSAELAHVEDHYSLTVGVSTSSFIERLAAPWHIYELPAPGTVQDILLARIRKLDSDSRRTR